ncbi:hypothetical protein D0Y65_032446 [Glycine soja]|uniref:DUF4283 domain-containing protein n=1 Tax=Glycine soja TaxID=3848 RepID=A0A445ID68_GLYSO|nr:hypothetical protein D0Y65_032446 [Glycine soja]
MIEVVLNEDDTIGDLKKLVAAQTGFTFRNDFQRAFLGQEDVWVKLLGRKIRFKVLENRLKQMWVRKGIIHMIDVGNDFFLVLFSHPEDKAKAQTEGPWLIYDHYLVVREWSPNFHPSSKAIEKVAVWANRIMDRGKIGIMKGSNIQMATQVAIVTHSQGPWTVVKKPRHQRKGKEREFQFTGNHVEKGGQGGSHAASRSRFVSLHEDEGDHAVVMEGDHEVEVRGKEYEKYCKQYLNANNPDIMIILDTHLESSKLLKTVYFLGFDGSEAVERQGDFNDIVSQQEKKRGAPVSLRRCQIFKDRINNCNLMDLGALGPQFTRKGPLFNGYQRIFERLDRAFSNNSGRLQFPNVIVKVLSRVDFLDHHPLTISLHADYNGPGIKPFRFECAWLTHPSFMDVASNVWENNGPFHANSEKLKSTLQQ